MWPGYLIRLLGLPRQDDGDYVHDDGDYYHDDDDDGDDLIHVWLLGSRGKGKLLKTRSAKVTLSYFWVL